MTSDPLLSADREREALRAAAKAVIDSVVGVQYGTSTPFGIVTEEPPVHWEVSRAALAALRTALAATSPAAEDDGTETNCPLEGVHEHTFRGPHRFREWDPASYLNLNDRPPLAGGLRGRLRPIVADWFDTGYENGKLDADVLTDRILAALSSPETTPAGTDAGLLAAYAQYAKSAEGAGTVQPRVVQRLVEAVFDHLAAHPTSDAGDDGLLAEVAGSLEEALGALSTTQPQMYLDDWRGSLRKARAALPQPGEPT